MNYSQDIQFVLGKFSHEIRNPLTTLYSTIQLIETRHPEAKNFCYWSNLTPDIEYINQLLDELSNFAKLGRLNLTTFDFRSFLEQISLTFAASIACSEVEYTSKIDSSIHQITGDKTKLQEVFLNLLKNAFDASKPDNTIRFTATLEGNEIVILVEDTGRGISTEQLPTIFEPFITYKKSGTGLGLAICEQIVNAHGGSISVTSSIGEGTTFRVTLKAE